MILEKKNLLRIPWTLRRTNASVTQENRSKPFFNNIPKMHSPIRWLFRQKTRQPEKILLSHEYAFFAIFFVKMNQKLLKAEIVQS